MSEEPLSRVAVLFASVSCLLVYGSSSIVVACAHLVVLDVDDDGGAAIVCVCVCVCGSAPC
jgi:hypothetical protein